MTRQERMKALWESPEFREKMKHRTRKTKEELGALQGDKAIRKERRERKRAERQAKREDRAKRRARREHLATIPIPIIQASEVRLPSWGTLRTAMVTILTASGPRRVPDYEHEEYELEEQALEPIACKENNDETI